MEEGSRFDREYKKLVTEINVPPVSENLYVRSLWNRDIPYKTWLSTFDNQNSKTKQPNTRFSTFDNQNSKKNQLDPRLRTSDKQNSQTVRPKVSSMCSS